MQDKNNELKHEIDLARKKLAKTEESLKHSEERVEESRYELSRSDTDRELLRDRIRLLEAELPEAEKMLQS